jgi:DNA (cytosine-5)-methyltransferase 1
MVILQSKQRRMKLNIKEYPEEVLDNGVKIYGETSYDNCLALLTHYLHNMDSTEKGYGTYLADIDVLIRDWLGYNKEKETDYTDADIAEAVEDPMHSDLFAEYFEVPFPAPKNPRFTFIDLFAGIGGFRIAMQRQGGKCVFSSEWNKFSKKTYLANFGEMPFGDITLEATKSFIPENFDILCAGFPCQPFSIAGVAKKNSLGRPTGFEDKTQGTLFFDVAEILKRHRPKAFFLENVKNLTSHDKGNTFRVIRETLEELDYSIHYKVLDGKSYVPQHRERILIIGFDKRRYGGTEKFCFPEQSEPQNCVGDILLEKVEAKYTLSDKLWGYLQNYADRQKARGNGFGFGLVDLNGITRTLSARYYKDGSEILIPQENKNPRKLTPRECARLMGYPDSYIINAVSDVQAYRQCGNSVVVPLMTAVAEQIVKTLDNLNHE